MEGVLFLSVIGLRDELEVDERGSCHATEFTLKTLFQLLLQLFETALRPDDPPRPDKRGSSSRNPALGEVRRLSSSFMREESA